MENADTSLKVKGVKSSSLTLVNENRIGSRKRSEVPRRQKETFKYA